MTEQTDFKRCTPMNPCPICGHDSWCMVIRGQIAYCMRVQQGCYKQATDATGAVGFYHRLTAERTQAHSTPTPSTPPIARASIAVRHHVYSAVLSMLGPMQPSSPRRAALRNRGFSDEAIDRRGYRDFPGPQHPWRLVQQLEQQGVRDLLQVPGFVVKARDGNTYQSIASGKGFLIPVRDEHGQIQAIKVRADQGSAKYYYWSSRRANWAGPKAVELIHVPLGTSLTGSRLRVTEGPLKADVCAELNPAIPTVALPSASQSKLLHDFLKGHPQFHTIEIAFDADFRTNPAVARGLLDAVASIRSLSRSPRIVVWDGENAKGIDDALVQGLPLTTLDPQATMTLINELSSSCGHPHSRNQPDPSSYPMPDNPNTTAPAFIVRAIDDPMELARQFCQSSFTHPEGSLTLRYYREVWYTWTSGVWRCVGDDELTAQLMTWLDDYFVAVYRREVEQWEQRPADDRSAHPVVRKLSRTLVQNVSAALQSQTIFSTATPVPSWLDGRPEPLVQECLFTSDSIVHLPSLITKRTDYQIPATPNLFNVSALPFPFTLEPPEPVEWLGFLQKLWPDDPDSIRLLQQWFGYCLVSDTRMQKLMLIVGATRSGKGTIAELLTALVGLANTEATSFASLGYRFGLWPLLDKSLAVLGDAHVSSRTDVSMVTERLKSITGCDLQSVDRKNLNLVSVRLGVRFLILSNEVPKLNDSSGVIANRIVALRTMVSNEGNEDLKLKERLLAELPGILLWAIAGWQELNEQGRFTQPVSGQEIIRQLRNLASEITGFVSERCQIGAGLTVLKETLFEEWQRWCQKEGHKNPGSLSSFSRKLYAAYPEVSKGRPREDFQRVRSFTGINLLHSS